MPELRPSPPPSGPPRSDPVVARLVQGGAGEQRRGNEASPPAGEGTTSWDPAAPMNHQPRYRLRERRSPGDRRSESLDSEDSQTNRDGPCYLEPWIVNLLLEYKESEVREDGQLGHILKVLNDARALHHDGECPAAVLRVADGRYYIQVVITATAARMTKSSLPQSGFSSTLGQFIILQNYRVCFKEAAKVDDCEFYLVLDRFRVMPMKRQEMRQRDWRSFALQPSYNSGSSVSEVLREIKEDQLSTLKENVEACLHLLNSEQLAEYPDTKWQVERRQDKMRQDTFTVPAKFLVIGAENEAALCRSYPPKPSEAVCNTGEISQEDDRSTISFFSAESESLDGSLENPWDVFPGISLTSSSETCDLAVSLPHTQQMLLARTAEEEEAVHSNSCTPEALEPCNNTLQCSSAQAEPMELESPSLLPTHSKESLKKPGSQETEPAARQSSKTPNIDESLPCGQPLMNSHSHSSMCLFSSVQPTIRTDCSLGPLFENAEEDDLAQLQRNKAMARGTGEKSLDRGSKCVAKRKRTPDREKPEDMFRSPTCVGQKDLRQPSTLVFPESNKLDRKLVPQKPSFKFMSTPKKSRIHDIQVQAHWIATPARCSKRLLETRTKQAAVGVATKRSADSSGGWHGEEQQERVRGAGSHFTYKPPTPELCSQVRSARISRALLGWARWVFNNVQKQ
ncbi:adrenocortical dysplasia protein homolog isoform X3 [Hemicordylus capensis]|uniref:adrenocortical dysplasia protein homolog isoform X3 n=1 Tax=Hemicordylus capensis TaxID=884348 RepID=UPI0023030A8E|nr:adrenocortical dysplasia protein homolog isoform X3 [Hemicordylus capensis]